MWDAPPCDRLDRPTRRAAEQIEAPMAFMSLLDDRPTSLASASATQLASARTDSDRAEADRTAWR